MNVPHYIISKRWSWFTVVAALTLSALAFINVVTRWYAWRVAPPPVKRPRVDRAPSPGVRFYNLTTLVSAAVFWAAVALIVLVSGWLNRVPTAQPSAPAPSVPTNPARPPRTSATAPAFGLAVEGFTHSPPAGDDSARWSSADESVTLRDTAAYDNSLRRWGVVVSDYRKARWPATPRPRTLPGFMAGWPRPFSAGATWAPRSPRHARP